MRFQILGPMRVFADNGELGGIPPITQRILGMLLLKANSLVTVDRLVEAAWDAEPPSTARRQVQNRIAEVRRLLRPAGDPIETRPTGYRLRADPEEVDALEFNRLTESGNQTESTDDAVRRLRSALSLWRGQVLEGLDGVALARAAVQLEEQRLQVFSEYIDLQLRMGHYTELIPELSWLIREYPLRERFVGQWMLALAGAGRRSEALDGYHRFRQTLVDEIGTEPGAALQQVHAAILDGKPGPAPLGPRCTSATQSVPRQLPSNAATFIGRERELRFLETVLSGTHGTPIAVIHGPGGTGKSTLAVRSAHEMAPDFPDGQLYADLEGYTPGGNRPSPVDVLGRFLRALGVPGSQVPAQEGEAAAMFRSVAADRRMLIVLDNVRTIAQVMPLLPGSPGCSVLITSRRRLTSLDSAQLIYLGGFTAREARAYLTETIGSQRVSAEPEPSQQIARSCNYLPLALHIASARLRALPSWPLSALAKRMADARRRLDELELPGDLSVRTSFAAAHQKLLESANPLNTTAADAFTIVTLIDGPDIGLPIVAHLLGHGESHAERVMEKLVIENLVDTPVQGRYQIHDLLKLFGREQAEGKSPAMIAAALTRAFTLYAGTAWRASALIRPADSRMTHATRQWIENGIPHPNVDAALTWSERERPNVVAAVKQAAARSDVPDTVPVELALAIFGFFRVRGYWNDAATVTRTALGRAATAETRAALQSDLGRELAALGQMAEAAEHLNESIAVHREADDRCGLAQALSNLGVVHHLAGHRDAAMTSYRESLEIHVATGNLRGQAMVLDNLGSICRQAGNLAEALSCHQRALVMFTELNDLYGQAMALSFLGILQGTLGRYHGAIESLSRSLSIFHDMGDLPGEAETLTELGVIARMRGLHQEAMHFQEEALAIYQDTGPTRPHAICLRELGITMQALGRIDDARRCWLKSAAICTDQRLAQTDEVRNMIASVLPDRSSPESPSENRP